MKILFRTLIMGIFFCSVAQAVEIKAGLVSLNLITGLDFIKPQKTIDKTTIINGSQVAYGFYLALDDYDNYFLETSLYELKADGTKELVLNYELIEIYAGPEVIDRRYFRYVQWGEEDTIGAFEFEVIVNQSDRQYFKFYVTD